MISRLALLRGRSLKRPRTPLKRRHRNCPFIAFRFLTLLVLMLSLQSSLAQVRCKVQISGLIAFASSLLPARIVAARSIRQVISHTRNWVLRCSEAMWVAHAQRFMARFIPNRFYPAAYIHAPNEAMRWRVWILLMVRMLPYRYTNGARLSESLLPLQGCGDAIRLRSSQ